MVHSNLYFTRSSICDAPSKLLCAVQGDGVVVRAYERIFGGIGTGGWRISNVNTLLLCTSRQYRSTPAFDINVLRRMTGVDEGYRQSQQNKQSSLHTQIP